MAIARFHPPHLRSRLDHRKPLPPATPTPGSTSGWRLPDQPGRGPKPRTGSRIAEGDSHATDTPPPTTRSRSVRSSTRANPSASSTSGAASAPVGSRGSTSSRFPREAGDPLRGRDVARLLLPRARRSPSEPRPVVLVNNGLASPTSHTWAHAAPAAAVHGYHWMTSTVPASRRRCTSRNYLPARLGGGTQAGARHADRARRRRP